MKNENVVIEFTNNAFGSVRTTVVDGEIFFVGKDVAKALGYSKPTDAVRKHVDAEDKTISEMETVKGAKDTIIINESGVYTLIFRSNLPNAKDFKRWVTSIVIPSIRKNDFYVSGQEDLSAEKFAELKEQIDALTEEIEGLRYERELFIRGQERRNFFNSFDEGEDYSFPSEF